jgi:putative ABC transport system permease protein
VLLNDLRNNPGVAGFATSWNIPTSYDDNFNTFYDPATKRSVSMRQAVIDDNLAQNIDPVIHIFSGPQRLGFRYLSVRILPGHEAAVLQQLTTAFAAMPSRRPFAAEWLDHRIDQQYSLLEGILRATNYIAVLTVFIAAMGLFGLIALYTRQRVREVGIRKVLGADMGAIVWLLSRNFMVLVGVALVIAAPIAWLVMHNWLQDFAYRVDIRWWMLAGAGGIVLVITLVTVGWHAVRSAMANPAEALRAE